MSKTVRKQGLTREQHILVGMLTAQWFRRKWRQHGCPSAH